MKLRVYLNMYGKRYFVGLLEDTTERRIFFEYAPEFIKTGIELSPFKLPLKSGVFEDEKRTFEGLFGLFNDSLPDGWGLLLLDRKLQKTGMSVEQITPLQRLSAVGKHGTGALEYEPETEELLNKADGLVLDMLAKEAEQIRLGYGSAALDKLLALNGSSGGARPKMLVLVSDDKKTIIPDGEGRQGFSPWLIKFTTSTESSDFGKIEYDCSVKAKKYGIDMPETFLFPSEICGGHFGVRRFDRCAKGKVHTHTACGLLHASHRMSTIDYDGLLRLTQALTRDVREVEKMFRLMMFNVRIGNKDDHSKNFSFVMNEDGEWKMSPAYDLTPSEGINGEHTALVNGKGANITDDDFKAVAKRFGIKRE